MKKFRFTADIKFDAENIDDVFSKLEKHFHDLFIYSTVDSEDNCPGEQDPWYLGNMQIKPIEEKNSNEP
jgi:hypothetical protein